MTIIDHQHVQRNEVAITVTTPEFLVTTDEMLVA